MGPECEASSVPSSLYISSVAQKANDVRFDPVLLLIATFSVLVIVLPGVHVLHGLVPGKEADTSSKSFDVQEDGGGKFAAIEFEYCEIKANVIKANRLRTNFFVESDLL